MAKVTIGTDDFDAFADLDFANLWLAGDILRATAWSIRNDDAKGRGLVSATRMMLGLPWLVAPDVDNPDPVQQQVASMLAADLLAKPALFRDASGASNIKTAKAGSAQVEFFRPIEGGPPFPADLWRLLTASGLMGSLEADSSLAGPVVSGICGGDRPLYGRYALDLDWLLAEEDYS